MKKGPYARITRVHHSWRVRVYGHPPRYFAPRSYGNSSDAALEAAIKWRDEHWDGKDRKRKLTKAQERKIQESEEHYKIIAERYGICPSYVHTVRRKKK